MFINIFVLWVDRSNWVWRKDMASDSENVMDIVEDVKNAEQEADRIVEEGRKKAEEIKRKGREEAQRMARQMTEESAQLRSQRLKEGHQQIEQEVTRRLAQAEKTIAALRQKRLDKKAVQKLARQVLEYTP